MSTKAITVCELIEILTKLPADLPVKVQGCDCIGTCDGARVFDPGSLYQNWKGVPKYVLITRND